MSKMRRVNAAYARIVRLLRSKGLTISTMESCTGGQVASFITNAEGSSEVLKSSLVTYSNEAKAKHGVDPGIISVYGVYSSETAYAMAKAAMDDSGADIGVGITGTFRNPDPANSDSATGVVNVVVCGPHVHHRTLLFIPHKNRMTDKIYVAQKVCEMIEKEIS